MVARAAAEISNCQYRKLNAGNGVVQRLLARSHDASAYAYAFDLLVLDGEDIRGQDRKAALGKLLRKAKPGIRYSEHLTGDGRAIFEHACKLGLEGIVSKRLNSPYRSGKSKAWLKLKNPQGTGLPPPRPKLSGATFRQPIAP